MRNKRLKPTEVGISSTGNDGNMWPAYIVLEGVYYYSTGKVGTNNTTGKPSAEYADSKDARVWYSLPRANGRIGQASRE